MRLNGPRSSLNGRGWPLSRRLRDKWRRRAVAERRSREPAECDEGRGIPGGVVVVAPENQIINPNARVAARPPRLSAFGQSGDENDWSRCRFRSCRRALPTWLPLTRANRPCPKGGRTGAASTEDPGNRRKGQVPDDGLSVTTAEGLELPRRATVGLVQDERLRLRARRNRVRTPALTPHASSAWRNG